MARVLSAEAEAVRALMAAGVPGDLVTRAMNAIYLAADDDATSIGAKVAELKSACHRCSARRSHRRRTTTSRRLTAVRRCHWSTQRKMPGRSASARPAVARLGCVKVTRPVSTFASADSEEGRSASALGRCCGSGVDAEVDQLLHWLDWLW